jgi:hypothetical protein
LLSLSFCIAIVNPMFCLFQRCHCVLFCLFAKCSVLSK